MTESLPRVALDSNVIYSRDLHELFGRLAQAGRFDLIWSGELLAEAQRVIRDRKPTTNEVAARWVGLMRDAFPAGRVEITTVDGTIDLGALTDDPDDHHVCALVIAGNADLLITSDAGFGGRAHLGPPLRAHGVDVRTADEFLVADVEHERAAYAEVVETQAGVWLGGRPVSDLLAAFERAGVPRFVSELRTRL